MQVLDGKATAKELRNEVKDQVNSLSVKYGRKPGLAVILVGEDAASQVYVRNKEKACEEVGFNSSAHRLAPTTTQAELEKLIDNLNADKSIDGILLQLPLPAGLDSQRCLERIAPGKDVDGFHPINVGKLASGLPGPRPCTPAGVMYLLKKYKIDATGKNAVVIGRSNIVGKPVALMLASSEKGCNATVTICHSKTKDLKAHCLNADILVLALGKPEFLTADMVKPGAVIIDVGINRTDDGLKGDCAYDSVAPICSAITPVPGGVGPMTIAMLMQNTLDAYLEHVSK